ncbi:MAG: WD40/YVTN/BNR-like repeat-containing protein, partial [Candidatus Heimdallarchaeota archaeon]
TGLFTFNFNILAIHPQDTALVFAVSDGGGIYRSKNGGANWELIVEGLTSLDIQSIAVYPQDTNKLIVSTASGIFKSLNGGDNWFLSSTVAAEAAVSMLAIDPVTPERIFAATTFGIYRSEDLGNMWTEKNNLPLDYLYVTGSFNFEIWQDSTIVIAPLNSTTMDTTIIFPYVYERALAAWIAGGKKGEPPVEVNPKATKMIFTPNSLLPPKTQIQVRIQGTFESDRETLRDSYGSEDIHGNSLEVDYNFSFTTGH